MTRHETFVITHDEAPKSLNRGGAGSRRHWGGAHREKRQWEGVYAMLLLAAKVPRGMAKARVDATLEFVDNRRRDVENYRPAIAKPLADALVKGGWLADDTDEFFDFGHVKIVSGVDLGESLDVVGYRKSRISVTIEAEYEDG